MKINLITLLLLTFASSVISLVTPEVHKGGVSISPGSTRKVVPHDSKILHSTIQELFKSNLNEAHLNREEAGRRSGSNYLSRKQHEMHATPSSIRQGFTLDPCSVAQPECVSPRECVDKNDENILCNAASVGCMCVPDEVQFCDCDNPCVRGETCILLTVGMVCVTSNSDIPAIPCTGSSSNTNKGLSGESCTSDIECRGNRSCYEFDGVTDRNACPIGGDLCVCLSDDLDDLFCSCSDLDCPSGEVCSSRDDRQICLSESLNPPPASCTSGSDTSVSDDVCVDANALSHIDSRDLVYDTHVLSRVVCDRNGSCATSGHIVHYMGSAMMMKTYCSIVQCEERVMHVNSPRYKRGIRVPSKTIGLSFTAFAARYGTRTEEAVMATAIRMGL